MPTGRIPGFVARSARATVDLPAVITPSGGQPIDARVRNISAGGFSAMCSATLPIGCRISLSSPELGRLAAQIRWALGARVGAVFAADLSPAARAHIARLVAAEPPGTAEVADPALALSS